MGLQAAHVGLQAARTGLQAAHTGLQAAHIGLQAAVRKQARLLRCGHHAGSNAARCAGIIRPAVAPRRLSLVIPPQPELSKLMTAPRVEGAARRARLLRVMVMLGVGLGEG